MYELAFSADLKGGDTVITIETLVEAEERFFAATQDKNMRRVMLMMGSDVVLYYYKGVEGEKLTQRNTSAI